MVCETAVLVLIEVSKYSLEFNDGLDIQHERLLNEHSASMLYKVILYTLLKCSCQKKLLLQFFPLDLPRLSSWKF